MSSEPLRSPDAEALLERLGQLLGEESLEIALSAAIGWMASLACARAAALFLFDRDQVSSEFWFPDHPQTRDELAPHLRGLAALSAERGLPITSPWPAELLGGTTTPRVFVLSERGRCVGVVVLAVPALEPERNRGGERLLARVAPLFAQRIHQQREAARSEAASQQYDHWFRMLDKQIRVLERERQKFAAVVNQTDTIVFVTDASGVIRWANRAMAARLPISEGEPGWVGHNYQNIYAHFQPPSNGSSSEDRPVERALRSGEPVHEELSVTQHGTRRNLYLTALPIKGPDGAAQEVMVMIQDLTDLNSVRRSEARYRLLFERSNSAIVMADPITRRIVLANPGATQLTGYPPEELLRLSLEDLNSPEDRTPILDDVPAHWMTARRKIRGCLVRTREGRDRVASVSASHFDLGGEEVVMVEFRDITERRLTELELQRAEDRLRTLVSNLPVVLFALDGDGTITLSEGRGLGGLGLKPGEAVGRSAFEMYRGMPDMVDNLRRALNGEEFTGIVHVGPVTFETYYCPVRGEDGSVRGLIGVATDITERRRLEDELRQSQKMEAIGRLAGGVAHDFNNLLTAILGHGQLLSMRLKPDDPLQRYVVQISEAGTRGALLTRQLLAFARREVPAALVLDLNAVLVGMDDMLRRLIGEDIELVTTRSASPVWIRADRGQIEQVVMNLVLNARDAMLEGGRLTLTLDVEAFRRPAEPTSPQVVLVVADNGRGMDEATRDRLFEPFFTTKGEGKGTGLGMSIVYGIVRQIGGDIAIDTALGRGTTVRVTLPRVEEAPTSAEPASSTENLGGTETILLVEDQAAVRGPIRETLEDCGYRVLEAESGAEALRLVRRHVGKISMVLTDVVMPKMKGGELVQRLQAMRPRLRVLYMSGFNDDAIVQSGVLDAGAGFLQKPFSLEVLAGKVREVLDAPARSARRPAARRRRTRPAA